MPIILMDNLHFGRQITIFGPFYTISTHFGQAHFQNEGQLLNLAEAQFTTILILVQVMFRVSIRVKVALDLKVTVRPIVWVAQCTSEI